jgi:SPP1 family holin
MAVSTIVRVLCLLLALVNQGLTAAGLGVLPINEAELEMIVSTLITAVFAIIAGWKNNSFTAAAKAGDKVKDCIKDGILTPEEIDELIASTRAQAE